MMIGCYYFVGIPVLAVITGNMMLSHYRSRIRPDIDPKFDEKYLDFLADDDPFDDY